MSVVISGCATSYNSSDIVATRISEDRIRINAKGNNYTDEGRTNEYVLLKAAEETKRYGFDMFKVTNYRSRIIISERRTRYANTAKVGSVMDRTSQSIISDFESFEFKQPRTDIIIKMLHGEMPENPLLNLYLADDVIEEFGPKYKNNS